MEMPHHNHSFFKRDVKTVLSPEELSTRDLDSCRWAESKHRATVLDSKHSVFNAVVQHAAQRLLSPLPIPGLMACYDVLQPCRAGNNAGKTGVFLG